MFSLQSFQPQLVVPLGQAASSLSTGIRNVTQNFLASRSCRPSQTQVTRVASTAADDVPAIDVTEEMRCTARELGLCDLPEGVKIEALTPLSHQAPPSGSTNTYTSAQSFFENKNGFQEGQLWDLTFGAPQMDSVRVTLPHMSQGLFKSIGISTEYQQRRGFKTKRSRGTGLGQTRQRQREEDDGQPLFRKYFKDSVFERIATGRTKTERFKSLLSDHDQNPEVQDKLKVAFAEGYAAHDRRESEQINSWARRGFRLLWYAIILWCVFQIFQAYSAIGGNMKGLNVLKGERYEVNPEEIMVTFGDVKGVDEAKQELQDVVEYLKMPEKFKKLGAKLPKGVLLVGPPGIGKTLLARAVAGEAGVPFFHASGSEFDEIFVGTGAKRVRQLFDAAKMRAPCVIFIDEIDTVGAKRTSSQIHPYANQTINQLLSEMDGFEQNEGVIVLGATNRRDNLDKALLRPGRFDVEVRVFPPDFKGRREILELYLQKIKYDKTCDLDKIARGTTGFTGADLENLVNQAALKAAMDNADIVDMVHLEFARDKVLMGPAKKTKIQDEETNRITAYHEAGHTLVAYYTKDAKPIHKVTIIPRGMSLGHTSFLPEKEEYNLNKSQLLAEMDVSMGGRVAEEIVFGQDKVTTGAASDFSMATNIATSMVKRFGMSEKVGVRVFDDNDAFDSGLSMLKVNDVSPAITEMVDNEIKRMLQESYERAKQILKTHPKEHKDLADALLKYETLDADDIRAIVEGRKLSKALPS